MIAAAGATVTALTPSTLDRVQCPRYLRHTSVATLLDRQDRVCQQLLAQDL